MPLGGYRSAGGTSK